MSRNRDALVDMERDLEARLVNATADIRLIRKIIRAEPFEATVDAAYRMAAELDRAERELDRLRRRS